MEEPNIIKTIIPEICPHCKKDIYIPLQQTVPMVSPPITEEDIKNYKEEVKKKLEEVEFKDKEDKEYWIKYLDDEETLITKSDVEGILQQIILSQQNEEISDKDKD